MISFRLFLEKRSHADQNPKISVVDALDKYKDDPDVYVHFSEIEKLGMNPQVSNQESPLGVYVYPLKEIWDEFVENDKTRLGSFIGRFYVWVLRSKNKSKFIKDLHKNYKRKDLDRDMLIIKRKYGKQLVDKGTSFDEVIKKQRDFYLKKRIAPSKLFFIYMHGICKKLKPDNQESIWNKMLVKDLGYTGIVDRSGKSYIHRAEKIQGVFLTNDSYDVITMLENKRYEVKKVTTFKDLEYALDNDYIFVKNILDALKKRKNNNEYVWVRAEKDKFSSYKISKKLLNKKLEWLEDYDWV